MNSRELKIKAMLWLRAKYPEACLTTELLISDNSMIDVAAIFNDEIIGVEIKGQGDTVQNIDFQLLKYSLSITRGLILTTNELEEKTSKKCLNGWKQLCIRENAIQPFNSKFFKLPEKQTNSPFHLASMLWSNECKNLVKMHNLAKAPSKLNKIKSLNIISENLPLNVIRPYVCECLKKRDWQGIKEKTFYYPCDIINEENINI